MQTLKTSLARSGPALVLAASLAFLVTACGSSETEAAAPTSAAPSVTSAPPASASGTPTPTAAAVPAGPPAGCISYTPAPVVNADGGDSIAAAAARAAFPPTVVLNPGVQVIASVDEPGMLEAVARVCSEPLTGDALIDVANAIALSIYQDPAEASLSKLVVSSWTPNESTGYLDQVDTVTVDEYQLYLWDSAVAQSTAWQ